MDLVERRPHDRRLLESVGVALAAALEPGDQVADRRRPRAADRPPPRSCPRARAPRRNRSVSWRLNRRRHGRSSPSYSPSRCRASGARRSTGGRSRPRSSPGSTASPAGPAIRKPSATSCAVVFHLATAVTGTGTLSSARYSRKPETRISRQRMTMRRPERHAGDRLVGGQHQDRGGHEQLVGDRVQHPPRATTAAPRRGRDSRRKSR